MTTKYLQLTANCFMSKELFSDIRSGILSLNSTDKGTQIYYKQSNAYLYFEIDISVTCAAELFGIFKNDSYVDDLFNC